MRTLRRLLVGTIVSVLLTGFCAVVAAQSEAPSEDPTWPKLTWNLSYGDDPTHVIHAIEPAPRDEPRPALVFFHGGGFIFGNPVQDQEWAQWAAERGYVAFMAGYRLFGQDGSNPWPAQLEDAQRAVQWVRTQAEGFNVDPERVCAIGHSTGGQLAGLVGTTEASTSPDPESDGSSSRVDCVVSVAGDADLTVPYEDPFWTEVNGDLLGGTIAEVPEAYQAASPAHGVDESTVPFLVIHGNGDDVVPVEMGRNLADALAAAGTEFVYAEVPADHETVGSFEASRALQEAFLAYQLHPEV